MESLEALRKIENLISGKDLTHIEKAIFLGTWEGKRYREIAIELGYEEGYLKDIGARLWRCLSDCLGREVTKRRVRSILNEVGKDSASTLAAKPPPALTGNAFSQLKFPGSPLPFGSSLYVRRSPLEELCTSGLYEPGSLIRIKAPRRMGKTSLINHAMGTAQCLGMKTAFIDIRQADARALEDLDAFLRWFCCAIGDSLGFDCDFETYWFANAGSKLNCTALVQGWLTHQVTEPLVIAIDTVHHLVDYPHIASHFFSMLRSWYEKARVRDEWQNLRLILAYVNDLGLPLQLHQSPFNVGLLLEISPFSRDRVLDLVSRDEFKCLGLSDFAKIEPLFNLIEGQPYLWQLALYWLQSGHLSLTQLVAEASTPQGIYYEYLRYVAMKLERDPALVRAVRQLVATAQPITLEQQIIDLLCELNLIRLEGTKAIFSCNLYRQYFSNYLAD